MDASTLAASALAIAGETSQAAAVRELLQEREHLAMQAQQLSAQLAKAGEASKADNLRMAQLAAALEEKTLALEAAEVGGRVGGVGWQAQRRISGGAQC